MESEKKLSDVTELEPREPVAYPKYPTRPATLKHAAPVYVIEDESPDKTDKKF